MGTVTTPATKTIDDRYLTMAGFLKRIGNASGGTRPQRFCFVLGAGASRSAGISMGTQLVDLWEEELLRENADSHYRWKKQTGITDDNKYQFYSKYYERKFENPDEGFNFLEKEMATAMPSAGHVVLAYLLCKTPHRVVVTTNFDHLIEKAVNDYAHTMPLVIGHEALASFVAPELIRPTIIKIHRDLLLDPKSAAKLLENLSGKLPDALGKVFASYHPIFIGYAGNDPSLMDFLVENAEKFRSREWCQPYWMLFGNERPAGRILTFLEQSQGRWVNHDGFDETLYQIGKVVGYPVPDEEDFRRDAEKRVKALGQAFRRLAERYDVQQSPPAVQAAQQAAPHKGGASAEQLMQQVQGLLAEEKHADALQMAEKLVSRFPDDAAVQHLLATVFLKMDRCEEAAAAARKATEREPGNARYACMLAMVQLRLTPPCFDEAEAAARRALELAPEEAYAHWCLAEILRSRGRKLEALHSARKATELDPGEAAYQATLRSVLLSLGLK